MYKQLTSEQRYAIKLGLQAKMTLTSISKQIGVSVSTVSREIKRNKNRNGVYSWKLAHEMALERREVVVHNRVTPRPILQRALKKLVEEDWSPEQISGYLALEGISISHETIYRAIRRDTSGELASHCQTEYETKNNNLQASLEKSRKEFQNVRIALGQNLNPILLKSTNILTYLTKALANHGKELLISAVAVGILAAAFKAKLIWMKLVATWNTTLRSGALALSAAKALLTGNITRARIAWGYVEPNYEAIHLWRNSCCYYNTCIRHIKLGKEIT
ncbi:MAG: helix-turn-helix domain-containing protein [Bacteroidales bacterium]|nr:helix-turn-helix domain-containing protein [Bacteroidales bacterium]